MMSTGHLKRAFKAYDLDGNGRMSREVRVPPVLSSLSVRGTLRKHSQSLELYLPIPDLPALQQVQAVATTLGRIGREHG